jgi:hypothetical protein
MMASISEASPLIGGAGKKKSSTATLQQWAHDTIAVTEGNPTMKIFMESKSFDCPRRYDPLWTNPEKFLNELKQYPLNWETPTDRVGDVSGVSALYADVDADVDKEGEIAGAAGSFMMIVGVIATLLMTIQFQYVAYPPNVHPLVSNSLIYLENKLWGKIFFVQKFGDLSIFILQQLSTLWVLMGIRDVLTFVTKCIKMYGALNYWCVDAETRVWFSRTWCIQESEDKVRNLIQGFCRSLIPAIFLSQGPIVALGLEVMASSILHETGVHVEIAKRMITYKLARKAQNLKNA